MSFKEWWFGPAAEPEPETRSSVVPDESSDDESIVPVRANELTALPFEAAMSIPAVYRAVQLIETSVKQLSIDAFRGADNVTPVHGWIRKPNPWTASPIFFGETANCLAAYGNAYWLVERGSSSVNLTLLPPREVEPQQDHFNRVTGYLYRGRTLRVDQIKHLKHTRVPGKVKGTGPVEATRFALRGFLDVQNNSSAWFTDSGIAAGGYWSTDASLPEEIAKTTRDSLTKATANRKGVPVVDNGLKFHRTNLTPKEALWIDAQAFNTVQVGRIFGIPASMLAAAVEGSSQTYSNVSQMWTEFARFTLTAYTREMELALSDLLPHGTEARFNFSALLRPDDTTRWAIHTQALAAGVHSVNEVRAIENELPIPGGDHKTKAELDAAVAQFEPTEEVTDE